MERIRPFGEVALLSAALYGAALLANETIFPNLSFITGVNWIYLPAGIRLLCTLLFADAGAVGLVVASWAACFFYFFPGDMFRSVTGGMVSALAPYLSYLVVERKYGLGASLRGLSGRRLLSAAFLYALIGSSLHHVWFWLCNDDHASPGSWVVMFIGDLVGTLFVLYFCRLLIALVERAGRFGSR